MLLCGAAYFFVSRGTRCDQFSDPRVSSPSGEWVAASTGKACPIGWLSVTDYSVSVTLEHGRPSTQAKPVVIFSQTDAGALPTLHWVSANELIVQLNDSGEVQTSQQESGGVKIRYVVPTWLLKNSQTFEVDRERQTTEAQELYRHGKISTKDLREELRSIEAITKERAAFHQWIASNASVDNSSH